MIQDDQPALPRLDNWAMLLAEHCMEAPTLTISKAWIEWFSFMERLRHRPKTIAIREPAPGMSVTIRRPKSLLIEADLTERQRESLRLARAHGRPYVLGRDPVVGAFVYFPKGYC